MALAILLWRPQVLPDQVRRYQLVFLHQSDQVEQVHDGRGETGNFPEGIQRVAHQIKQVLFQGKHEVAL